MENSTNSVCKSLQTFTNGFNYLQGEKRKMEDTEAEDEEDEDSSSLTSSSSSASKSTLRNQIRICPGPEALSLQVQAALLFLLLLRVSLASIHLILGINHKVIENMQKNLEQLRKKHVVQKENEGEGHYLWCLYEMGRRRG